MRIELNLSQEGLAALCPPTKDRQGNVTNHDNSWISRIENNINEPALADLAALATALKVDVRWLLSGQASGMSEFTARMAEIEAELDGRAVRLLLATALQQVEELREERQ